MRPTAPFQSDRQCQAWWCPGAGPKAICLRGLHILCRSWVQVDQLAWLDRSVASPPLRCAGQLALGHLGKGDMFMVVLGIDAHKRTHTVVAVDEAGRRLGVKVTQSTSTAAHL